MLQVSWMTMTKMNGGTMIIMNSVIMKVSHMKQIMVIYSKIRMILTILFVLKVSWITTVKMSGLMRMNPRIMKVSPMRVIMGVHSTYNTKLC